MLDAIVVMSFPYVQLSFKQLILFPFEDVGGGSGMFSQLLILFLNLFNLKLL